MAMAERILVIRRDNIGDLVLTTPLLRQLRSARPAAHIGLLVNTYNRAVVERNTDIDALHIYEKAKHSGGGLAVLKAWWQTLRLVLAMRRQRYQLAILAGNGYSRHAAKFARLAGIRQIVAYQQGALAGQLSHPVAPCSGHHAEVTAHLLSALGIQGEVPAANLAADAAAVRQLRQRLGQHLAGDGPLIGLHISARKPQQRWPQASFLALMQALRQQGACRFVLFWSPGPADHPAHPGDDDKAQWITAAAHELGIPLLPLATGKLEQLINGLAICDLLVCSDGGAMHLAAAQGKPIVCFFGNSDAAHWYPWRVPYRLLQRPSLRVEDITVEEALAAVQALLPTTMAAVDY